MCSPVNSVAYCISRALDLHQCTYEDGWESSFAQLVESREGRHSAVRREMVLKDSMVLLGDVLLCPDASQVWETKCSHIVQVFILL